MALSGKVKGKSYLFTLLKEIIKKKMKIRDSYNTNINTFTYGEQKKYSYYTAQEKLLVKILNECFNLNVDTALIAMEINKEDLK